MRPPITLSFVLMMGIFGAGAAAGGTVTLLFPNHPYALHGGTVFHVAYTVLGFIMMAGSVKLTKEV